jgi:outer membrane protein assembly factor BamB
MIKFRFLTKLAFVVCLSCALPIAAAQSSGHEQEAGRILDASGVKGGLIVHVGCGGRKLTAALRASESYLIHGLDTKAKSVKKGREYIKSLDLYGPVSIDRFDGKRLPYIDNLVNLLVAEDLGNVPMTEVMRVLCPNGVAYIKEGGKWKKRVKPRPKDIDEWTHFLHGPDNNAVSADEVVGFPYHIQWIGSPIHSRDHEITTSMDVMVSAGGRIFYIIDEGPTAMPHYLPSRWYLVARDAFNGVVLWKRPLFNWRPYLVSGRKSLAADMWRRLVATADEVYVTETIFGPVIALDPGTGEILRRYEGTEKTEEIIHEGGILYLVVSTSEPENIDRRQLAHMRVDPDQKRIMAVKVDTGEILWAKKGEDTTGVHPLTLAVRNGRLLFQNTREIVCLRCDTGNDLWRYRRPSNYSRPGYATPTLVVCDDVVLSADRVNQPASKRTAARKAIPSRSELIALSAKTCSELWRCGCEENVGAGVDVFVANGLVWVGENPRRGVSDYNHGRDLYTGAIKKKFAHAENWPTWHHHRCYRDKATEKYILAGRTGIEFVDLDSGELTTHHWVRGICEYGIMPCNGLIYSPPDQCACYIESRLHGFHALTPRRESSADPGRRPVQQRLEKGPAYGQIDNRRSEIDHASWPTFRHDNSRSSYTRSDIPLKLKSLWNTQLGGKLTSLVSAEGRLYVAQPETHTVFCLDSSTGKILWRFQTGGRVDSPPSICQGIAVFGCRDGWVYALRASDGELVWRFRAAPQDRRLVEDGQIASVWPVHGSVLVDRGSVFFAAGRSSYLDGGMWLYRLELATGKTLLEKHYYSRDPKTGKPVSLYTAYDGEVLPDRELPGLLPDVLSWDGKNLYMRAVPLSRDLVIRDKEYVPHLFSSMGFLEDTWWERTYWIYGSHFYGGARGHAYARTLFPGGRILTFDEESVYGYQDLTLNEKSPGIFCVAKNPDFVDLATKIKASDQKRRAKGKAKQVDLDREDIARRYVWINGVPQNPKEMNLTGSRNTLGDAIRKMVKYEYTWQKDVPLYAQAMLLTDTTFFIAGPARFDEQKTREHLSVNWTDRFHLNPLLQDALDKFEGRKGGILLATAKASGEKLAEFELPSSPVFDGVIAANGRLFMSLTDGSVLCMAGE